MNKKELLIRYAVFILGLFINSLGVALITKADLGTSPISSIPFTLSLTFTPTLGQFTIIFSLLLILIQIILERKSYQPVQLLQIPWPLDTSSIFLQNISFSGFSQSRIFKLLFICFWAVLF